MKDERLTNELLMIKKSLIAIEKNNFSIGGWLPKNAVLRYFDYSENQLRNLEKKNQLKVSKIGRRKFYFVDSIKELIENNIDQK